MLYSFATVKINHCLLCLSQKNGVLKDGVDLLANSQLHNVFLFRQIFFLIKCDSLRYIYCLHSNNTSSTETKYMSVLDGKVYIYLNLNETTYCFTVTNSCIRTKNLYYTLDRFLDVKLCFV